MQDLLRKCAGSPSPLPNIVLMVVLCVVVGRRQRCYLGMGWAAYRLFYGKDVFMGFNGRAFG